MNILIPVKRVIDDDSNQNGQTVVILLRRPHGPFPDEGKVDGGHALVRNEVTPFSCTAYQDLESHG